MITKYLRYATRETDENLRIKLFFNAGEKWARDKVESTGPFAPAFFAVKGRNVIPFFSDAFGLEDRYDVFFEGSRILAAANESDYAILITYRRLRASGPPRHEDVCMDDVKFTCVMVYIHSHSGKHVTFYPVGWGDKSRRLRLFPPSAIPHEIPDMVALFALPEYAKLTTRLSRDALRRRDLDWIEKVAFWDESLSKFIPK